MLDSSAVHVNGGEPVAPKATTPKPPTSRKSATPKVDPTVGTIARFYENKSNNLKAPVASVELELTGLFSGMIVECNVWARRSTRGDIESYSIDLPYGRGGAPVRSKPMFIQDRNGIEHPISKTKDTNGQRIENTLPGVLLDAFYRYQKSGNPVQVIKF
jgi:hypothetical protein